MAEKTSADVLDTSAHIMLEEFCTRLSNTDKRVELIGGFEYTEKSAGRIKDAESEYQSRYTAFATKPV